MREVMESNGLRTGECSMLSLMILRRVMVSSTAARHSSVYWSKSVRNFLDSDNVNFPLFVLWCDANHSYYIINGMKSQYLANFCVSGCVTRSTYH